MEKKSSWLPIAGATAAMLVFVASGCAKDLDALSAEFGKGGGGSSGHGGAGKGGSSGGAGKGGSSASGGVNPGEAGVGGESGESDAGEPGSGGTGAQGGAGCGNGLTSCPGTAACTDLNVGNPDGNGVNDCGACGTTCDLTQASSATCKAGTCALICQTGLGDCNAATANDGCETDTTTLLNCGACNYACSNTGASSVSCDSGQCTPVCAPYYADCNSGTVLTLDDGCERYLDALDQCTTGCGVAGVACGATQVCNAGSCGAPAGVVVLSTPAPGGSGGSGGGGGSAGSGSVVTASRYADVFASPANPDLTGSTVTVRLYAPGATKGVLWVYLSDSSSNFSPMQQADLSTFSQKWTDITIPAPPVTQGSFNPKSVKQVTIEVHFDSAVGLDPTIVYVDSVRSSNLLVNDTFDSSFVPFVKSGLLLIPGSTLSWAATVPASP